MKTFKKFTEENDGQLLSESNLSRIHHHLMNHDCAIITAFRADPFDRTKCCCDDVEQSEEKQKKNILSTNKLNNRDLKAILLSNGCGVTAVDGSFIENYKTTMAVEVKEDSLFVVDLKDSDFFNTIINLGKKYCQDVVLLLPKGCKGAYLYGTNNSQFPGLDAKVKVGDWKGGKEAEFMTKVGHRPFVFETYESLSWKERMTVKAITKNEYNY
jgi:hypothetical protein